MNERIKHLAYWHGLYASGTPDSWDEEALTNFGKAIVEECINAVEYDRCKTATTYDKDLAMGIVEDIKNNIKTLWQ